MSHLLTSLADRALGTASTIEPVRSPMFSGEPSGYGEPAEHGTAGFVYGDIVTSTQAPRPQTREASVGSSDTVASQVEKGDTPASSVQPLASRVLDELPAADENSPSTRNSNSQQQGHDIMASSTLVDTRSKLTETIGTDPDLHATAFSPVTSRASHTINSHSLAHPFVDEQGLEMVDVLTERQASSDPLAQTSPGSLLRPRVSSVPSFPAQQSAIDNLPRERNNSQTPQPAIQVTIGRIEVRAVTTSPPQAPRARKKPQPSLSLDDYLKQRT